MARIFSALAILICSLLIARGADESQEEFLVLNLEKQRRENLTYYAHHAPTEEPGNSEEPAKFEPMPKNFTAHVARIGFLTGRDLVAVRYLADASLKLGNDNATMLVILCADAEHQAEYLPLVIAWGEQVGGDLTVSPIRKLGDFEFIWVRREYSGKAHAVARTAIAAADVNSPFRAYPLFDQKDPLAKLRKEGWEMWTSGHFFDEEKLTWFYRLYREPDKMKPNESAHRRVSVRYKFKDGKLRPGKPKDDDVEN